MVVVWSRPTCPAPHRIVGGPFAYFGVSSDGVKMAAIIHAIATTIYITNVLRSITLVILFTGLICCYYYCKQPYVYYDHITTFVV